jgi:hypothetical protein
MGYLFRSRLGVVNLFSYGFDQGLPRSNPKGALGGLDMDLWIESTSLLSVATSLRAPFLPVSPPPPGHIKDQKCQLLG